MEVQKRVRLRRCASSGNLLTFDSGDEEDDEEDMKKSFVPGLLGKRQIKSPSKSQTPHVKLGRIRVTVKMGIVYEEEVDAIINSTSQTLTLSAGSASRAMLQKAGQSMQDECNRKYPKGITFGQVAETGGGDLFCGYVFHGCIRYWKSEESNSAEQSLVDLVSESLKRADALCLNSIAIPALGTGFLSFPAKTVIRLLLQSIKDFDKAHKTTTLTDVKIVIFPKDTKTYQEFEQEISRYSYTIFFKPPTTKESLPQKPADIECMLQKVKVQLVAGSLLEQKVDVILNISDKDMRLRRRPSSKAILKAAGDDLQQECQRNFPVGIDFGDVVSTGNHGISNVKAIYHGTLPRFTARQRENHEEVLYFLVQLSLMKLNEDGYQSIAFPTLGVGDYKYPHPRAAQKIFPAIQEYCTTNTDTKITLIRVVVDHTDPDFTSVWKSFQREIEKIIPPKMKNKVPIKIEIPKLPPARGSREWFSIKYEEDACVPVYWTSYKGGEKIKICKRNRTSQNLYKLEDVDKSTMDLVENLVQKSWQTENVGKGADARGLDFLGYNKIRVTRVQRVENLDLYENYVQERQRYFDKARVRGKPRSVESLRNSSGPVKTTAICKTQKNCESFISDIYSEVNEHFVFHGTLKETLDSVLSQGLDCRMSRGQAMFGQGAYGAESSTKADQYVDKKEDRKKSTHKMMLVRMCLGDICLYDYPVSHRRAPCKRCRKDDCKDHIPKDFYDSVVADGKWLFREFVVYDKRQTYPEYLITYERI